MERAHPQMPEPAAAPSGSAGKKVFVMTYGCQMTV